MTSHNHRLRIDLAAARYLDAVLNGDVDAMAELWDQSARDPELSSALREVDAGLAEERERFERERTASAVTKAVEEYLPSAEILRPELGPVTVGDVADELFRHAPNRLPAEGHALNEKLRSLREPLPADLGLSSLVAWGEARFGPAPPAYWDAFRRAAVKLELRRGATAEYYLAARRAQAGGQVVTTIEIEAIVSAVAALRRSPALDAGRRGPVLLAGFFAQTGLDHVELPRLSRGAVAEHLMREGIPADDLGDPVEELAGFVFVSGRVGWAYAGAADPLPRRRFTAAHELGHFVLHRATMGRFRADTDQTLQEADGDLADQMEREANRFAVELLMPAEACRARAAEVRREFGCCPRGVLTYRLASELLVSVQAMRYRLADLEVGDE